MNDGKDPFPVFHINSFSTLAHTVAKLVATRSHRYVPIITLPLPKKTLLTPPRIQYVGRRDALARLLGSPDPRLDPRRPRAPVPHNPPPDHHQHPRRARHAVRNAATAALHRRPRARARDLRRRPCRQHVRPPVRRRQPDGYPEPVCES